MRLTFVNRLKDKAGQKSMVRLCALTLLLQSNVTYSDNEWHNYANKHQVRIHYIAHQSGAIEVKGKVVIAAVTAADFLTLLSDTEMAPQWIENISQVKLLTFLSGSENLVYTFIDSPWPVSNRDVVTYSCYQQLNAQQSILKVVAKPDYLPVQPNRIRIKTLNASWLLTQSEDALAIEYQVYSLPEGAIPLWLNNKVVLKSVAQTLANLRRMLSQGEYATDGQVIQAGLCSNADKITAR